MEHKKAVGFDPEVVESRLYELHLEQVMDTKTIEMVKKCTWYKPWTWIISYDRMRKTLNK